MRVSIRWKLMGSYLLLTLVMGGIIYGYLSRTLENYIVAETREGLLSEARLARLLAVSTVAELRRDAPATAAAIARETRARVTVISPQGEVLGDSEVKPDELKELENHLNRPEVQEALKTGQGTAVRYSSTLRSPMLYVALPLTGASGEGGVLRLALPLSVLKKAETSLNSILVATLALAALISLILSYLLTQVTSRTLRTMAGVAAQLGTGKFGRRIPVRTDDELGELAGVMNDMAIRIEAQVASLASEKNRLNAILQGMGEGLMVADAAGVVTLVNPAFRALFSVREDVTGRPIMEIARHPALNEAFRSVMATRTERFEEIAFSGGDERTILTHWVPLEEQDGIRGVVAVFHDISDLKRLEKIRRDFVANVSHELRTPVTVIKGYAEALLGGVLESDPVRAGQFVAKINNHAERLASLVADLLELATLESGQLAPELAPLSIEGAVRQACSLLEQRSLEKGVALATSGVESVPAVLADRRRLEQVLFNLLDNAIKYTPAGGMVTVSASDEGEMVRVAVTDTGIGIPSRDLPRIFERFYRVDTARSRELGGTGLGLAIVKHIVLVHGGEIAVESTPGKGTTFSFTLKKG
jgi:two-component system, OmpR family, phosphate regulon sensor histidine kinase PhoR